MVTVSGKAAGAVAAAPRTTAGTVGTCAANGTRANFLTDPARVRFRAMPLLCQLGDRKRKNRSPDLGFGRFCGAMWGKTRGSEIEGIKGFDHLLGDLTEEPRDDVANSSPSAGCL